jgi:hypothetical protein
LINIITTIIVWLVPLVLLLYSVIKRYCIVVSVLFIAAWEHGTSRGSLEGVQPDGGGLSPCQGQLLHQEQRRFRPFTPLLPERAQRDLPGHPASRLQTRHKE